MLNQRGFTLIEWLIVVVILMVLTIIAIPAYFGFQRTVEVRRLRQAIESLETRVSDPDSLVHALERGDTLTTNGISVVLGGQYPSPDGSYISITTLGADYYLNGFDRHQRRLIQGLPIKWEK